MDTQKKHPAQKEMAEKSVLNSNFPSLTKSTMDLFLSIMPLRSTTFPEVLLHIGLRNLSNYASKSKRMSKDQEIKKLRERIEELEFVKDFQQDMIVEFEKVTGEELSKKFLPEHLAQEIQRKKKKLTK